MTTSARYAKRVTAVLRDHFPGMADPVVSSVITEAVRRQAADPQVPFEVIVDDPVSANWRLKPSRRDRRQVRLHCFGLSLRGRDYDLQQRVNDALAALAETIEEN